MSNERKMSITYQWLSTHVSELKKKKKMVSGAGFQPASPRNTSWYVSNVVTRWCSGYQALLVLRGDAGWNPARDTNFFFQFRDVCRKPLVSYLHLSFIASKSFVAQIIYIPTTCPIKILLNNMELGDLSWQRNHDFIVRGNWCLSRNLEALIERLSTFLRDYSALSS